MKRLAWGTVVLVAGIFACLLFGPAYRRLLALACDGLLMQVGIARHVTGVETPSPIDGVLFAVLCTVAPARVSPARRLVSFLTGAPLLLAGEVLLLGAMMVIANLPPGPGRPYLEAAQSTIESSSVIAMPWLVWLFCAQWPNEGRARPAHRSSRFRTAKPRR